MHFNQNGYKNEQAPLTRIKTNNKMNGGWRRKRKKKAADAPADDSDAPADSPDDAADVTADDSNGAVKTNGGRYGGGVVALALGLVLGLPLVLWCELIN